MVADILSCKLNRLQNYFSKEDMGILELEDARWAFTKRESVCGICGKKLKKSQLILTSRANTDGDGTKKVDLCTCCGDKLVTELELIAVSNKPLLFG